jgi:hypothetical protein
VLDLRKFVEIHTQHTHCLKILSTPVYKNNSRFSIKNYICPKLRKLRKEIEINEQRMNIFSLVYNINPGLNNLLDNKEPRKTVIENIRTISKMVRKIQ